MKYKHIECGGEISPWKMRCLKCGKHWWNPLALVYTKGIRPMSTKEYTKLKTQELLDRKKRVTPPKWADRAPGAAILPALLPNWPRWMRILFSLVVLGGPVFLFIWWVIL